MTWLFLSYEIGHLFFRQNPNVPDRASLRRISGPLEREEKEKRRRGSKRWDAKTREAWFRRNFACNSAEECEFPYDGLSEYLIARNHQHLADLIRLKPHRTKTTINQLKIRLQFYCPEKYRPIIRNEANARMATSTWYITRTLIHCALLGLCLAVLAIGWKAWKLGGWSMGMVPWADAAVLSPLTILCLAYYVQRMDERSMHYQRLREIFYVLELAYTAFRDRPDRLASPPLPVP